jgi:hypothetical protein
MAWTYDGIRAYIAAGRFDREYLLEAIYDLATDQEIVGLIDDWYDAIEAADQEGQP